MNKSYSGLLAVLRGFQPLQEMQTRQKPQLGSGTESQVYPSSVHPGRVISLVDKSASTKIDKLQRVYAPNPEVFAVVYKIDPRKRIAVLERLDTEKVHVYRQKMIDWMAANLDAEFKAYSPTGMVDAGSCIDNLINYWGRKAVGLSGGQGEFYQEVAQRVETVPELMAFVQEYQRLCEKASHCLEAAGYEGDNQDAHWDNIGYDTRGKLKFLDI